MVIISVDAAMVCAEHPMVIVRAIFNIISAQAE